MTVLMTRSDDDYREFVGSFADPLSRVAFLLTVGLPVDAAASPDELVVGALAQLRWHWREVEATGAPESFAVEALVSIVRRRFRRRRRAASTPVIEVVDPVDAVDLDGDSDGDADGRAMRNVTWAAWQQLPPMQRLPTVLADLSVASRRLAGIDVTDSLGSARRLWRAADVALSRIRAALLRDPATNRRAIGLDDAAVADLVQETLRERVATAPGSVGAYFRAEERVRRTRRRIAIQAAIVVVVLIAGVATAVKVSTPTSSKAKAAAAASASAAGPTASRVDSLLLGNAANRSPGGPVVAWPTRGNAAADAVLLAQLRATFLRAHPDVIGSAQVLLAQDTSTFRVAYVVANSPAGVVQSWFYGKVGSAILVEGGSSYGSPYSATTSVVASILVDPQAVAQLVVIAPPVESGIQISNFDPNIPLAPGREWLTDQHGVADEDIAVAAESTVVVHVLLGAVEVVRTNLPIVTLGPPTVGESARSGPAPALPSVERGTTPDPGVFALLLGEATAWHNSDAPGTPMRWSVLWAGTDEAGTQLVVARLKMRAFDALLFEWGNDSPDEGGQYLIDSKMPDGPMAFAYDGVDGTRIGVLAPLGPNRSTPASVTSALVVPGEPQWGVEFDSTGFASLALPDVHNLMNLSLNVDLLDNRGHLVEVVPVPPPV